MVVAYLYCSSHHVQVLFRNLGKPPSREEILSLSRDQVEDGLSFVALLLFRNELKSDTRVAIENLKDGQVNSSVGTISPED